ncbi:MAG TPA: M23 family metallopeptidase [Flavipsychrobacter sp.]|nr:M23 family metallopeptidase [Flavipsychrobacter sp.]
MIVYSLLLITILIALWCIYRFWKIAESGGNDTWHRILIVLFTSIFIYLYGAWVFLSVYAKYVFGICLLAIIVTRIFRKRKVLPYSHKKKFFNLLFTVLLGALIISYYTGTTGKPETVNLSFPFKHGQYMVFQGGKGLPTNLFHYGYRGAIYAMDIIKLNSFGNRANKIFSHDPNGYTTFGDTIYSPCNGIVVRTIDTNPDNTPPNRVKGPGHANQILIDAGTFYVFLAHIKQRNVFVHKGDTVHVGQPLGCAGNSGFTIEPHLHIQAHINTHAGIPWYREKPLFIKFDGREYLLF